MEDVWDCTCGPPRGQDLVRAPRLPAQGVLCHVPTRLQTSSGRRRHGRPSSPRLTCAATSSSKIVTTRLANEAGVASVPNVLGRAATYPELVSLADSQALGHDLVVQTPYGDSGKTTFFIAGSDDWERHQEALTGEDLKVMRRASRLRRRGHGGRHHPPRHHRRTGHAQPHRPPAELTPYRGGWCGNGACSLPRCRPSTAAPPARPPPTRATVRRKRAIAASLKSITSSTVKPATSTSVQLNPTRRRHKVFGLPTSPPPPTPTCPYSLFISSNTSTWGPRDRRRRDQRPLGPRRTARRLDPDGDQRHRRPDRTHQPRPPDRHLPPRRQGRHRLEPLGQRLALHPGRSRGLLFTRRWSRRIPLRGRRSRNPRVPRPLPNRRRRPHRTRPSVDIPDESQVHRHPYRASTPKPQSPSPPPSKASDRGRSAHRAVLGQCAVGRGAVRRYDRRSLCARGRRTLRSSRSTARRSGQRNSTRPSPG